MRANAGEDVAAHPMALITSPATRADQHHPADQQRHQHGPAQIRHHLRQIHAQQHHRHECCDREGHHITKQRGQGRDEQPREDAKRQQQSTASGGPFQEAKDHQLGCLDAIMAAAFQFGARDTSYGGISEGE